MKRAAPLVFGCYIQPEASRWARQTRKSQVLLSKAIEPPIILLTSTPELPGWSRSGLEKMPAADARSIFNCLRFGDFSDALQE